MAEENKKEPKKGLYHRWLSPEGYLGLHLVIGFVVAILCGLLFSEIAENVFFDIQPHLFDAKAQAFMLSITYSNLTTVMRYITLAGNPLTLGILTLVVAGFLYFQRSRRRLYAFCAIMIGGSIFNFALKAIFQRQRPSEVIHLVTASGYSFPSGHSMGSMLFYGGLAYVVFFSVNRTWGLRVYGAIFCLLAAIVIGLSRVYLGVHYLSDVLAGFAAALCWIGICVSAIEGWVRVHNRRRSRSEGAIVTEKEALKPEPQVGK